MGATSVYITTYSTHSETLINQADFNKTFTQTASVNTSSVRENSQGVTISLKKKQKKSLTVVEIKTHHYQRYLVPSSYSD